MVHLHSMYRKASVLIIALWETPKWTGTCSEVNEILDYFSKM